MRCRVYRSLDAPSSILGIKGGYLFILLGALAASLLGAAVLSALLGGAVGVIAFLLLAIASYFLTLNLQSRYTPKELSRLRCALKLHSHIMSTPRTFSSLWNSRQDSASGSR